MTVLFSEEEWNYIIKDFGNWKIKEECPEKMRERIQRKIKLLEDFANGFKG